MSTTTSTKDQKCLTIAIVGLPSTGKSSLINALIGLFLRSASKNRDTFVPTKFQMRKAKLGTLKEALEIAKNTGKVKNSDKEKFEQLKKIKEGTLSIKQKDELFDFFTKINEEYCGKYICSDYDYDIIDFPGFGDPTGVIDGKDFFLEGVLQNMIQCDLIVYVVDSNSPFLTNEQMVSFEKIIARRDENLKQHHHYSEVFVAATKYDDDDEEVQEMWKDMHTTLKMPKENIFFVSNYQMFFENMQQFIYLPFECKQEFINIYKHIYGRKGGMPNYSAYLNSTITKQQFIGKNPLPTETKTKCEFVERLKSFCNGLEERRAKPKYDLLMKILNDKILVKYFKLLSDKELMKLFLSISKHTNKLPEDLELNHITRDLEVRITDKSGKYHIDGSKRDLIFSTEKERYQAAAILSNIVSLSKQQTEISIIYFHNIIKENLLQPFHYALFVELNKTVSVIKSTTYFKKFIQELTKYRDHKCYVTRQFIWYLFSSLGKPSLITKTVKEYITKGVEKLDAETLLMIDSQIKKNTKLSVAIKKLFTKEVCVSLMAHLIREKKEYLFSFDGFVFDDEFELFKMFTKISFADLAIFKETDNNKFEDMKSLMNEKYLPSLNYYCSKHDTNFIFPKILYPLKKTAEILKLEKFLDS